MTRRRLVRSMLLLMVTRAVRVRGSHTRTALLAIAVAAATATCLMNLYVDVQRKLMTEFRGYGANLVVVAKANESLGADALGRVDGIIGPGGVAVPFSYVVATTKAGAPVVVAGTDFERVRRLNRWWSVSRWPTGSATALLGARAAPVVSPHDQQFEVFYGGRSLRLVPAGTLRTGGGEDSRVYAPLSEVQQWSGAEVQSIEVAVTGTTAEIMHVRERLAEVFPAAEVRPIRQIVEAEARVLGKTRSALLASVALIIATVTLCVVSTLTAAALDRRKETALMKALGAPQRLLTGVLAAEAALLGAVGALLGFPAGVACAAWIGRTNFSAAIAPRWELLPIVIAGCVGIALVAAVLPLSILGRVQPAVLLKGE